MKNIDFLPDHYHHQRMLGHSRLCWMGVASLFALAIAGTASGQWYLRQTLDAQLRLVEPKYVIAQQRQAEIAKVMENGKRAEELAALYIYLEHPWPRTQLLAAIAQPLTPSIQLTSLNLIDQTEATLVARGEERDTNHSNVEGEKPKQLTPQSVLARLRGEHDHQRTILELSGETENTKDLHEYVDCLAKSPLFASASLKGLESGSEDKAKKSSRFEIRVVVRPGYGQPGAPSRKADKADVAVVGIQDIGKATNPGALP
ncbi:MAG: PilN domain-containing protein [Planctomycetales bacterium]|nr:PilN domain-containing protein [Planctomycetales bacterium]